VARKLFESRLQLKEVHLDYLDLIIDKLAVLGGEVLCCIHEDTGLILILIENANVVVKLVAEA